MKKLFYVVTLCVLISCGDNSPVLTSTGVNVDSLLKKNVENTKIVTESSKKSDTTISNKVDNTVKKIGNLETQINELKAENNELKNKLDDANDAGQPYRFLPVSDD